MAKSLFAWYAVIEKKKDGANRVCIDYWKLNSFTVADPKDKAAAEDLLQRLGKKYFSKLYLSKRILADFNCRSRY